MRQIDPKRPWWADCTGMADLAQWIDGLPARHRVAVLTGALSFRPEATFEQSWLVGIYRAQLSDCLLDYCGSMLGPGSMRSVCKHALDDCISAFETARNLAEVQLALCDLIELIAGDTTGSRAW